MTIAVDLGRIARKQTKKSSILMDKHIVVCVCVGGGGGGKVFYIFELHHKLTWPEVIILSSCSFTQLSMKFILLINVKMPTMVGILHSLA